MTTDPESEPGQHVTVEFWVSPNIADPVRLIRDQLPTEGADLSILDVYLEDPE